MARQRPLGASGGWPTRTRASGCCTRIWGMSSYWSGRLLTRGVRGGTRVLALLCCGYCVLGEQMAGHVYGSRAGVGHMICRRYRGGTVDVLGNYNHLVACIASQVPVTGFPENAVHKHSLHLKLLCAVQKAGACILALDSLQACCMRLLLQVLCCVKVAQGAVASAIQVVPYPALGCHPAGYTGMVGLAIRCIPNKAAEVQHGLLADTPQRHRQRAAPDMCYVVEPMVSN